jgi:hypothetical protein
MLERLAATRDGLPIWVDSLEYCQARILRNGALPWGSPAEIGDFFAKMDGLFSSDAILLDVRKAYAELVVTLPGLLAEMGASHRPGHALKVMLGDASLRSRVLDAVVAVAGVATSRRRSLVVSIPSPLRWLREADRLATTVSHREGTVEQRQLDAAATYSADHLRALATVQIDAIVIDEGGRRDEAVASLEAYRPIVNIAAHYGWLVLHRSDLDRCWSTEAVQGVAASLGCCAPQSVDTGPWGAVSMLSASAKVIARGGSPGLLVVPKDAEPNDVTSWMSALR